MANATHSTKPVCSSIFSMTLDEWQSLDDIRGRLRFFTDLACTHRDDLTIDPNDLFLFLRPLNEALDQLIAAIDERGHADTARCMSPLDWFLALRIAGGDWVGPAYEIVSKRISDALEFEATINEDMKAARDQWKKIMAAMPSPQRPPATTKPRTPKRGKTGNVVELVPQQ